MIAALFFGGFGDYMARGILVGFYGLLHCLGIPIGPSIGFFPYV